MIATTHVDVFDSIDQLRWHCGALQDLLTETGAPVSAQGPALRTWLAHHADLRPLAIMVRVGTSLSAAALLTWQPRMGLVQVGRLGEAGTPGWLAARDERSAGALATAVADALQALDRPWYLRIGDLPDPDPVATALREVLPVSGVIVGAPAPQLRFAPGAPLSQYLSRNTRAATAKAKNRVARDGLAFQVRWDEQPDAVAALLPEIVNVHRRRNRQLRGEAILDDPAAASLFADTVLSYAQAGRLRLLTVRLDGELAAFAICTRAGGMLWVYANLVSPDWLRYSAGTIANAEVIRAAYADPAVQCVDWGAGIQRYKMSGEVTLRSVQHLLGWSSPALHSAWLLWQSCRRVGWHAGCLPLGQAA